MTLSTFPTFLTFLAQALCFPVPASDPWQGLEIPSYPRRERSSEIRTRTFDHKPSPRRFLA